MKTHFNGLLLVVGLCLLTSLNVQAQFNKLFTSDNGLPNSLVNDITQDTDGMLWIGTENGLSCFNGSRFINYRARKSDKHSLANNFIRRVCAGDNGQILLGTVAGVQIYDKRTGTFSEVISTEHIGVSTSNVNDICRLHDGTYFIVGYDAYTMTIGKDGSTSVSTHPLTKKVTGIYGATEGRNGDIWCASTTKGVWRAQGRKVSCIKDEHGRNYDFCTICTGTDGRIYAGQVESGLYVYDARSNRFALLPGTECLTSIRDIMPLPKTDIVCVAMDGSGVRYYDTRKCRFVDSGRFSDPFVDISSVKAHALYIDDDGNIWMALYQKGVYFVSSSTDSFGYYGSRSQKNDIIGNRCVTSIMQSHDGSVWVSTDNGGLYGIAPDGKALRHFIADDSFAGLPTTLLGLFQDSRHRTWFGSFHRGSGIVDLATGRCTYIPLEGVSSRLFSVYQYVEDKRGVIWAATMGHGIATYDEKTHTFKTFNRHDDVQWSDCLFYDPQSDILYAGTYDGVVWFSATGKNKKWEKVCGGTVVYSISRISDRLLAFCTTSGLIVYDTVRKAVSTTVTQDDGLPDDNVLAAQMGNDGKLWISSSNGLVRYDMKHRVVEAFSVLDGLQGNEFYKNAALVGRDGRLWFGGINGITVFSPRGIGSFRPHECVVQVASLHASETYTPRNADGVYVLPDGCTSFTVELSTRPLHMSRHVTYYYKLDDDSWESLPVSHTQITFKGISYGTHRLQTKTSIGGKETEVFETTIYVPYPWYLRWWALLIWTVSAAALAAFVLVSVRRRRQLRLEMQKHKDEETLVRAKLAFFTNVVHDLRTPLSLIVSPLHRLKGMGDDERHTHLYGIIEKNAARLLRLSNEIMDLRKLNMGKMKLNFCETAVSELLDGLVDSMRDLGEVQHQSLLTNDRTDGTQVVWMDPAAIEKVMLNLLGNAIKYGSDGGTIVTEWYIADNRLHVTVTDDGQGIPDSDKELVFMSYFQRLQDSRFNSGVGLGLSLVKSLITLHHGEIHVEDNPEGHGTRMHFALPLRKEDYPEQEVAEESVAYSLPEEAEPHERPTADLDVAADGVYGWPAMKSLSRNILIVDDDADILDFLTDELSGVYNIVACRDGREAMDTLLRLNNEGDEKRMIDIVVTDIMMPGVDGMELCQLIRKNVNLCHIPVVMLTAKASDTDRLSGLQAAVDAYIVKPFNIDVLTAVIANLLKRQDVMRSKYKGNMLPADSIETPELRSTDDVFLEKLTQIINDNIGKQDLTADFLANEMDMSRVHLYRRVKELTNQSVVNYIRNIRLAKGAEMLSKGRVPISDVARMLGFKSVSHFSSAFRSLYGVPPTAYKK